MVKTPRHFTPTKCPCFLTQNDVPFDFWFLSSVLMQLESIDFRSLHLSWSRFVHDLGSNGLSEKIPGMAKTFFDKVANHYVGSAPNGKLVRKTVIFHNMIRYCIYYDSVTTWIICFSTYVFFVLPTGSTMNNHPITPGSLRLLAALESASPWNLYHLERIDGATPISLGFCMLPYKSPSFGSCAIYFQHGVRQTTAHQPLSHPFFGLLHAHPATVVSPLAHHMQNAGSSKFFSISRGKVDIGGSHPFHNMSNFVIKL